MTNDTVQQLIDAIAAANAAIDAFDKAHQDINDHPKFGHWECTLCKYVRYASDFKRMHPPSEPQVWHEPKCTIIQAQRAKYELEKTLEKLTVKPTDHR